MAHRRRRHRMEMNAEINVVPLIDVMLLLLVIFMLTAPMMQGGVDLTLPEATAQPIQTKSGMTVSIDRQGVISINESKMDNFEQFRAAFPSFIAGKEKLGVNIAADAAIDHGSVVRVMAAINEAGVENIGILTVQEEGRR